MNNIALIIGDRGQDGTLLRESLGKQGFQIFGVNREYLIMPDTSVTKFNFDQMEALIQSFRPCEIYYLPAHHVSSEENGGAISPSDYEAYHKVHVTGLLITLWAVIKYSPSSRIFYAGSSLIYSGIDGPIQNENTPFTPVGYYGLTKAQGIFICREFRERYGLYTACGILYNHESVLRSEKFLSKKLIASAHKISLGLQHDLTLGSLSSETDWGYAPDYVESFQRILRTEFPDDYVIATGESHSVAEFAQIVFDCFDLNYLDFVREDNKILGRKLLRKVGDSSKLKRITGWRPSYSFQTMVQKLVSEYLERQSVYP